MAKTAPYLSCTVTIFWLKFQDPARMLASGNAYVIIPPGRYKQAAINSRDKFDIKFKKD
jgi:hypothetical protein